MRFRRRKNAHSAAIVLIVALVLAACGGRRDGSSRRPQPRASTHLVEITGFEFVPEELIVAAGDTVVWTNRDIVPHTVTGPPGMFDSGEIGGRASWEWVARRPGNMVIHCKYHPLMTATIDVRSTP